MAVGVCFIVLWRYVSFSIAVQTFGNNITNWPLWGGVALLVLGSFGAFLAWCSNRCCLCFYAWLAMALGGLFLCGGTALLLQPTSFATKLERLCEEASSPSVLGNLGAPASVQAAQSNFDSMLEALSLCRRHENNMALRLDACPNSADMAKRTWQSNPNKELFRWAENKFTCGGFCKGAPPIFGLPRGTVNEANRGQIRHACFSPIAANLRQWALVSAGALLSAGFSLLMPSCCACWLACAPPPLRRPGYVHHPNELEWTAVPLEEPESDDAAWD